MFIHSEPGVHTKCFHRHLTQKDVDLIQYKKMFSALDAERCSSTPNLEDTKCFHRHLTQKDVYLIHYKKCFHRQMFIHSEPGVYKMFSPALDAERCSSTPNLEYTKCFHRYLTQKDVYLIHYKKCFHRQMFIHSEPGVYKMFSPALDAERCSSTPNLEYTKCFHLHLTQKEKDVYLIHYKKCFHRHLMPKDVHPFRTWSTHQMFSPTLDTERC